MAVTFLFMALLLAPSSVYAQTVNASSPPEAKLASIDLGSREVPQGKIRPYAIALDSLKRKCTEPRDRIADFSVVGVEELGKKRVKLTHLRFLRMMDASIPASAENAIRCAEVAAALVVLTERP